MSRFLPIQRSRSSKIKLDSILFLGLLALAGGFILFSNPVFYLLAVAAIFTAVLCLANPLYGLMVFILLSGVQNTYLLVQIEDYFELRWYPALIPIVLSWIGLTARRAARIKMPDNRTPVDGLLLVLLALETITLLWAPDFAMALYMAVILLTNIMLFFLFTGLVVDERSLYKTYNFWIFCGFLSAMSVILNQWWDTDQTIFLADNLGVRIGFTSLYGRPGGWSGPSHLVGFAATGVAMAFGWLLLYRNILLRLLFFVLIVISISAVVLSETRGVLISLFAGVIFHLYIFPHLNKRILGYSLLGISVITITLLVVQPRLINRVMIGFGYTGELLFSTNEKDYNEGNVTSTSGEPEGQSGMRIRIWWWVNGLKAMAEDPLTFLVGLGQGGFAYHSQGSPEANGVVWGFFYDLGLVGMVLFFLLLYLLLANIRDCLRNGKQTLSYYMFLAVLTGFFIDAGIHGLVDFDLNSYGSKNFWMPFGLLWAAMNVVRRETADESIQPYDVRLVPGRMEADSTRRQPSALI